MMIRFSKIRPGLPVCSGRTFGDVPLQADPDVHLAVVAERRDRVPGPGVDRRQESAVHVEQPAIRPIRALPVVHAAVADRALVAVRPDLLAARGVERDDRSVRAEHVHHAVDDDRIEPHRAGAGGKRPGDLELLDVGLVDLLQRRVLVGIRRPEIAAPGRMRLVVGGGHGAEREGDGHDADDATYGSGRLQAGRVTRCAHVHVLQGFVARI